MHPILKAHCETGNFGRAYIMAGADDNGRFSARKVAAVLLNHKDNLLDSHPDFWEQCFDVFGINEISELKHRLALRPVAAPKRFFLIRVKSFTSEGAISLSNLLEDLTPTCCFFLLLFSRDAHPSFRSKLVDVSENIFFALSEERKKFFNDFLNSNPAERINLTKKAADDKIAAFEFLNELEIFLEDMIRKEKLAPAFIKSAFLSLEELQAVRSFFHDRAPSAKMIIEHFALTLPQL